MKFIFIIFIIFSTFSNAFPFKKINKFQTKIVNRILKLKDIEKMNNEYLQKESEKYKEDSDTILSLTNQESKYKLKNIKYNPTTHLFEREKDQFSIHSTANFDIENIDIFIPFVNNDEPYEFLVVLSEKKVVDHDYQTGLYGIALRFTSRGKGNNVELQLISFHSEKQHEIVHLLTCQNLNHLPKQTAIHISYKDEINSLSISFVDQRTEHICEKETFIYLPKRVFFTFLGNGNLQNIGGVFIKADKPQTNKKNYLDKRFTLQELKTKNKNEILEEIYYGLGGIYKILNQSNGYKEEYEAISKELSIMFEKQTLPLCGEFSGSKDLLDVMYNIEHIDIDKTYNILNNINKFNIFDSLRVQLRDPITLLFWFITLAIQIAIILTLMLLTRKKSPIQMKIN